MSNVNEIKNRIKELMKARTLKTDAIKILKREYKLSDSAASSLWITVKQENGILIRNKVGRPKQEKKETKKKEVKKSEKMVIAEEEPKQSLKEEKTERGDKGVNKKLKIVKATVKGDCGVYEKEGTRVEIGELVFSTIEEVDKYASDEMAKFKVRVKEIKDVMLMEL